MNNDFQNDEKSLQDTVADDTGVGEIQQKSEDVAPEQGSDVTASATDIGSDSGHLSGIKLWLLLASISSIFFVLMLDMSIIATVSHSPHDADPLCGYVIHPTLN